MSAPVSFDPVRPRANLSAALIDSLVTQIESGALVPGQRLPTEHEIIAAAGVSRSVVREALASLRARGLIVTRQGLGAFVAARPSKAFAIAAEEMSSLDDVLKLLELRAALESEGAALAAERRTAADLAAIDDRLDGMDAAIRSGGLGAEEDYAIHAAILAAAQNPYFTRMMETFGSVLIPRRRLHLQGMSERDRTRYLAMVQREHRAIRGAIKRRDAEGARRAAYAHLKSSYDRYRSAAQTGEPSKPR
jgi:DNA-binding FadR family transcriptional regulator